MQCVRMLRAPGTVLSLATALARADEPPAPCNSRSAKPGAQRSAKTIGGGVNDQRASSVQEQRAMGGRGIEQRAMDGSSND